MFNTKITARQCEQETYTHILLFINAINSNPIRPMNVDPQYRFAQNVHQQITYTSNEIVQLRNASTVMEPTVRWRPVVYTDAKSKKQKKIDEEQKEVTIERDMQ
ncbi:hypothetical protein FHG87_010899 [Trinorchestia longiramus]|nr:hypothetical protein FHG87_010899 [Trinorchestia longiramus]